MIRLKSLLNESATADSVRWAKQFKQDLGLTDEAAAAMAANIQHESGFIANRIQGPGVKTGTMQDSGNLGYSWAQWTYGPRKENFKDFIKNKYKTDINKTPAQNKHAYAFLKHEIANYPGFNFDVFKNLKDINKATEMFVDKYEQAGKPMLKTRQAIATDIVKQLKPSTPSTPSTPETAWDAIKNVVSTAVSKVNAATNKTYTVKSGETLSGIAKQNKTTVVAIQKANPGINPNKLKIGQKIKLP